MKESNKQRYKRQRIPQTTVVDNPRLVTEPQYNLWEDAVYRLVTYFVIAMVLAALAACTPTVDVRYVTRELTRPPRPVLPKVAEADLSCVSQDTYQKLYDRQRLISEYAKTLEAIVDSTKPKLEK